MKLLRLHAGILGTKKRSGKRVKTVRGGKTGGTQRLRVDGAKLRKLREDAELSVRALAFAVGVDPSTVMDLESGQRESSQLRTVRSLASHPAIDVDYSELLIEEAAPAPATTPRPAANIPPRSSLDAYVNEERQLGPVPRIDTEHGALPLFGATDLVRVFSSPSNVAGERFCVSGRVHATRGLSYTDGLVLGIRHQDGSRFEILRHIGTLETPMSLTVLTTTVEQTRRLQTAWTQQTDVTLVIRVVTTHDVPDDTEHVFVTNSAGGEDVRRSRRHNAEIWRGFTQIEPKGMVPKPHPWALLVDAVIL
jgi:transcriptional regulator with XRE-family HTH domain